MISNICNSVKLGSVPNQVGLVCEGIGLITGQEKSGYLDHDTLEMKNPPPSMCEGCMGMLLVMSPEVGMIRKIA